MQRFEKLTAPAAPIDEKNIDTDRLAPARFLMNSRADGYAQYLFHDRRFDAEGKEKTDFILNQAPFRAARIVVADDNFGSGSSREHAVWALVDYGIRAVIAPSFGPILFVNSLKNGLLPLVIDAEIAADLRRQLHAAPGSEIAIDLERQEVTGPDGARHIFEIAPAHRHRLLEGLDDIDLTLAHADKITEFEKRHAASCGWLF